MTGAPRMTRERLVVIGNGMAGCRAVQEVLKRDPDRYEIAIFGAEPRVNYDRIMLSPVLAGEKAFADIVINDEAWYRDNGITLHAGRSVVGIDREACVVRAEGGIEAPYDRLILATGSDPIRLPLPGADLAGVVTFRDLDDVEAMIAAAAKPGARAVVIGGGLLGIEAAYGLVRAYGQEWDAQLGFRVHRTRFLLKYASYDADRFGADTDKFWFQIEWSL